MAPLKCVLPVCCVVCCNDEMVREGHTHADVCRVVCVNYGLYGSYSKCFIKL